MRSAAVKNSLLMPNSIQVGLPQLNHTIASGGCECHTTHVPFQLPHLTWFSVSNHKKMKFSM
jgi:hypothetical protein